MPAHLRLGPASCQGPRSNLDRPKGEDPAIIAVRDLSDGERPERLSQPGLGKDVVMSVSVLPDGLQVHPR